MIYTRNENVTLEIRFDCHLRCGHSHRRGHADLLRPARASVLPGVEGFGRRAGPDSVGARPAGVVRPRLAIGAGVMAPRVVVAGGHSAGHIEPTMNFADALRRLEPTAEIIALGAVRGLDTTLIPARGYPLELILAPHDTLIHRP